VENYDELNYAHDIIPRFAFATCSIIRCMCSIMATSSYVAWIGGGRW
jgi:hypothetical protein